MIVLGAYLVPAWYKILGPLWYMWYQVTWELPLVDVSQLTLCSAFPRWPTKRWHLTLERKSPCHPIPVALKRKHPHQPNQQMVLNWLKLLWEDFYSKFFDLILSYHGLSHLIFVCTYGHFYYLIKDTWLQHGSSMAWQTWGVHMVWCHSESAITSWSPHVVHM